MTREEALRERDRARQEASERAEKERSQSSKERQRGVQENNTERRQEKNTATNALMSGSADIKLAEIARQGGTTGRRLEREIRQFQQTGRVSSWLAGETVKAEAAQNAAQQSAFKQQVVDVISTIGPALSINSDIANIESFNRKPEINDETSSAICIGLNIYIKDDDVWIGAGTIAGQLPSGFNPIEGKFIASSGSGQIWAKITIDENTGQITQRNVEGGSSLPSDTNINFHYALGFYQYSGAPPFPSVTNYGCGPLDVTLCRNWFVSDPPFFTPTFVR